MKTYFASQTPVDELMVFIIPGVSMGLIPGTRDGIIARSISYFKKEFL